ncbi:MAG: VWA domain-containing protein [Bacteroidota bacterium]
MIPDVQFSDNVSQRTPCVLVVDGSTSMRGDAIHQLNAGLHTFEAQLKGNPLTALRVQVLVIVAGGHGRAEVVVDWCDAIDFTPPAVAASGTTPLGTAMSLALDKVEAQKQAYDRNGISSTRPWILLISDGEPNDVGWEQDAARCRRAEADKRCVVFPIGTRGANMDALGRFSQNAPKRLAGLQFSELFVWLSRSMTAVSQSAPGERVQLPATSWEQVDL